jgi:hypothetical protein
VRAWFDGFSLHAGVVIAEHDREALARLCRYGARPAFAAIAWFGHFLPPPMGSPTCCWSSVSRGSRGRILHVHIVGDRDPKVPYPPPLQ